MESIGATGERERQVIVDDEGDAAFSAQPCQDLGDIGTLFAFVAILQQGDATFERPLNATRQFVAVRNLRRNRVQAAQLHRRSKKRLGIAWPRPSAKPA